MSGTYVFLIGEWILKFGSGNESEINGFQTKGRCEGEDTRKWLWLISYFGGCNWPCTLSLEWTVYSCVLTSTSLA